MALTTTIERVMPDVTSAETQQHPRRRGLSGLQRHILGWLLVRERTSGRNRCHIGWDTPPEGAVAWCPSVEALHKGEAWTPTRSAVFSRAVARLAQRGLVERVASAGGRYGYTGSQRTTHLRLTDAGRVEAKRIVRAERDRLQRETANKH